MKSDIENPLTRSLERLADKVGDPTRLVYAELYQRYPEHEARFFMDTDGSVRGEMLSQALDVLMRADQGNSAALTLTRANRFAHDGYDVSENEFNAFFCIIRDVTREALNEDWTPEFEDRWREIISLLSEETSAP